MPNFVYESVTLPTTKEDYRTENVPSNKKFTSAEMNIVLGALADLRTALLAGRFNGWADYEAAVSEVGFARMRYKDGELQLSREGAAYEPLPSRQIVLDGKDFGIEADDATNDAGHVQALVDMAAEKALAGYAVDAILPSGIIQTRSSIVLPRLGWSAPGTIRIMGRGVQNTRFADSGYLGVDTPMWTFDANDGTATAYMTFADMSWARSGDGKIFEHLQLTDDEIAERLIRCRFENLHIRGKASTTGILTKELLHIQGGIECNFTNVWGDGGEIWAHLENGSHLYTHGFGTTTDTYSHNGILIAGGGNHIFEGMRVEGTDEGYGVRMGPGRDSAGPVNVVFVGGPTYEGKKTSPMLDLDTCNGVTLINPALGSSEDDVIGIKCKEDASNIEIIGGRFSQFSGTDSYAIQCDANFKGLNARGLSFYGVLVEDAVDIDPGVYRVSIEGYDGSAQSDYKRIRVGYIKNAFGITQIQNHVREYEGSVSSGGSTENLDSLPDGYENQEFRIWFANANVTLRHLEGGGNLRLAGALDWNPPTNSYMKLVYQGGYWWEDGRNDPT